MNRVRKSNSAKQSGKKTTMRPVGKHNYRDRTEDQGQSIEAAQKSALRYFNDCLAAIMPDDMPVKAWPDVLKVDGIDPFEKLLVKDTWGKYADHLIQFGKGRKNGQISWNTLIGYLSKMKNVIIFDISKTNNMEWVQKAGNLFGPERTGMFSKLIRKLTNTMLRDCTEDGTELVKSAPYMTKADQE